MPSKQPAFVSAADASNLLLVSDSRSEASLDSPITFVLDAVGNFKFVNRAAERSCGYTRQELDGMNISQIVEPQLCNYLRSQLRRNLRQRFGTVYEVEVSTKDGRRLMLEVSIHLVRDSGHEIEVHGVALPPRRPVEPLKPRCLDDRFAFSL